jgi:hypothetical protein
MIGLSEAKIMIDLPTELARHYREESDRVRKLAFETALPGTRDALISVGQHYEYLAESLIDPRSYKKW